VTERNLLGGPTETFLEFSALKENVMTKKHYTKFIQEGQYAAAVEIERAESDTGWSPHLTVENAQKEENT
jgi:hypothetical protein